MYEQAVEIESRSRMGRYIVAADIGTSSIRAVLYDHHCQLVHHSTQKVCPLSDLSAQVTIEVSGEGEELRVEIDPESLLRQLREVVADVCECFDFK